MQYLRFIPAELNEILGQHGFRWPNHLLMAASGGRLCSLEEICAEQGVDASNIPFPLLFEVLVQGEQHCVIEQADKDGKQRRWQVYHLPQKTNWLVVVNNWGAIIKLAWFENESAFLKWCS